MTTTANKQGLKAAAAKRTAKHAQRTPLPSKATRDAIREQNVAELIAESPTARYGMMTVAQLKAEAKSLGLVTYTLRTKGALLNALLARTNEQAEAKRVALAEAKVDATFQPAQPGDEIAIETAEAPSSKSGVKAQAFATKARQLGWKAFVNIDQVDGKDRAHTRASRDAETITIEWEAGVFNNQTCLHTTPGGRVLKLRNASHALKRMALAAVDVAREDTKVGLHTRPKATGSQAASGTPSAPSTPYFSDDTPDNEVLAAVRGKAITWINALSGGLQTDKVRSGAKIGLTDPRVLAFLGESGFRTVRVSAIVSL